MDWKNFYIEWSKENHGKEEREEGGGEEGRKERREKVISFYSLFLVF
jgi:hypothetical protein